MARSNVLPYLAFSTVCLIWGSTFLFIGLNEETTPPLWALSMRLFLAGAFLCSFMAVRKIPFPTGAALKTVLAYGFCEFALNLGFLYWGEAKIPSGLAAVIYGTSPILTMLMAGVMQMEKLDVRRLLGAIVAVAGIAVIFWREIAFGVSALGILSVFGGAVFGTLGVLLLKRGPEQSAIGANAVGFFVALPFVLACSFVFRESHPIPTTPAQWMPLLYLVVMGSLGAFVLFAWLIGKWKTSSASFVAVVIPIVALVLGFLVRGEKVAPGSLLGVVIVISATAFVLVGDSRPSNV